MNLSLIKLFSVKKLVVILLMNSQLQDVLKIFTRYACSDVITFNQNLAPSILDICMKERSFQVCTKMLRNLSEKLRAN